MRKIFILSLMLIASLCARNFTDGSQKIVGNEVKNQNVEIVSNNTEIPEDEIINEVQESEVNPEIIANETQESEPISTIQENTEKNSIKTEKVTKTKNSQNIQDSNNAQMIEVAPEPTIVEPVISQEDNTQANSQTTENNMPSTPPVSEERAEVHNSTPQDLSYWCVEGGSHHVMGDGANEHGYYNSWAEAEQAFQTFTAGWNSLQYKIEQCACGKYYFWSIQN